MTLAFDEFLKHLNSNGPQRLSGFDRSQFEGLDIDELPQVEAMLEAAAQRESIVDINALGVLGTPGALVALKRILLQAKSNTEARVEALSSLLSLTRDKDYRLLTHAIPHKSTGVRERRRPIDSWTWRREGPRDCRREAGPLEIRAIVNVCRAHRCR